MIVAYAPDAVEFESNGLGVLEPTSCEVSETLNGAFELTLTHPIDDAGKWRALKDSVIIKAPCPTAGVPPVMFAMVKYDLWKFSQDSGTYVLTFDEGGNVTGATQTGTLAANTWFKARSGSPMITYGGKQYKESILSYTDTAIAYAWQRIPGGGTQSATSGGTIYLQADEAQSPDYTRQGQITDQLFRVYRTLGELDRVQVYAHHIFYDLRHDAGPRGAQDGIAWKYFLLYASVFSTGAEAMYVLGRWIRLPGYAVSSDIRTGPKPLLERYSALDTNYVEVLLGKDGLCELYGGEVWRNNRHIGLYSRLGQDTPVVIREGKNLTGLRVDQNGESVVTRVFPYGKGSDGSTRPLSHFDPTKKDNVDSARIGEYPFPRTKSILVDGADLSVSGSTAASVATKMLTAAQAMYTDDHVDEPEITVDVNFELIEYLQEYELVKGLERVFLGDSVRVISERLGVDMQVRVNSYVFDCLSKRYKKLSMESNMRREGLIGTFERYIADSLAGG